MQAVIRTPAERRASERYDAEFPDQLVVDKGQDSETAQIALVLIYPNPALPESTCRLCMALTKAGFAPLVLANAALREEDRIRILPHVWRLVQRPNIGHDFGGYRDGFRLLRHWNVTPDEVLVLNDSVWFLDNDVTGLVDRLRGTDADVAGSILRSGKGAAFLESYCYLIPRRVLLHPASIAYWNDLVLSSNKYKVIRAGERGHSAALSAAGFRLGGAFTQDRFLAALEGASDEIVADTLRHAAWLYKKDLAAAQELLMLRDMPEWRAAAMALIHDALTRGLFYSLFPVASRRLLGYPFLKRSSDRVAVLWRRAFLDAIEAGALAEPDPVVLEELRNRVDAETALQDLA